MHPCPEESDRMSAPSLSATCIWAVATRNASPFSRGRSSIAPAPGLSSVTSWTAEGLKRHGWLTRNLVPTWFGNDNVHLSADHLPYLLNRFDRCLLEEQTGTVPFIPFARVPYYIFTGRKPLGTPSVRD